MGCNGYVTGSSRGMLLLRNGQQIMVRNYWSSSFVLSMVIPDLQIQQERLVSNAYGPNNYRRGNFWRDLMWRALYVQVHGVLGQGLEHGQVL